MDTRWKVIVVSIISLVAAIIILSTGLQQYSHSSSFPDRILLRGYLPRRSNSRRGTHG
ncbi:hypothetical protein LINPERPRIM_LOCUS29273 [Linum perenne]